MVSEPKKELEIFFSYTHKDLDLRDQLETHLSLLKNQGFISGWHDRKIIAGMEWAREIDAHLWWSQKSRQFETKNKIELNHTRISVLLLHVHLCRCLIRQRLMKTLLIVKREVRSQVAHGICHALVIFDINVLIFHTSP